MFANAFKRGGIIKSAARGEERSVQQERQEPKWTIAEMKAMVLREREIRQQAQLAAEQALTAAKEAKKMILQLEEELDTKDQQLQQERASRKQAELTAQELSKSVAANGILSQPRVATTKREERDKSQLKSKLGDYKTDDEALGEDAATAAASQSKRPHEATKSQPFTVSKKRREPGTVTFKETPEGNSRKKMSLAEARKAARQEVEKRIEERANAIESKKKI
ncbi:hypothetical protein V7S43_001577 [Phytophthora oleae]|uniref:Casein kinase substrate phosphoprotein PP28 domain-containing protein n=1 Tax=Phytophthora oleae TaxID=2107226 RepID=A0ABD3G432_9STRA